MNIILVSQRYHPFVGGIETHARQVAQELHRRQHEVRVAAMNFKGERLPKRLGMLSTDLLVSAYPSYQDGDVPVNSLTPTKSERLRLLPLIVRTIPGITRLSGYDNLKRFGYHWYQSVFVPNLLKLVQGVDVVHMLGGDYLGWAAQTAAQKQGIPFICTPFVHPHQWGDDPGNVAYYQRSQAVIALLESDRQYLIKIGVPPEKIHIIGVSPELAPKSDPEEFRRQHGLENVPFVLFVGRIGTGKGAKALLAAAPLVWQKLPNVRLVFIGPLLAEALQWFEDLDPRILYLGKVSTQEKANALAACDIFCLPSMSEVLPTVYLEAWSYAKPVIGGRAPGLPELLEGNEAGIAVEQDPEAIDQAIDRLLTQPELGQKLGQHGQKLVERCYTVSAVVDALESLYSQVISSSPINMTAK